MAEALKAEGNKLLQAGDNEGAVKKYTEAIAIDPKVFFNILDFSFFKTGFFRTTSTFLTDLQLFLK